MINKVKDGVQYKFRKETVLICAHGENGMRIRATYNPSFSNEDWALLPNKYEFDLIDINENGDSILKNGKLTLKISEFGKMAFFNQKGELLLKEYYRTGDLGLDFNNEEEFDDYIMIHKYAREFKKRNENYQTKLRFYSNDREKIFGMGQYQMPYLNLKGCILDLEQINTQASVPFYISSLGYGFLWNNPAIGKASFSKNITEFSAKSTSQIDYWITCGDSPSEIEENYSNITGKVPMMDDQAMGFWQSKLRYQSQDELLDIVREYKKRNIPLKIIVLDFFHWTNQGDWKFDNKYWPNPKEMIDELNEMGVKLMVSVWPTVDNRSENYKTMVDKDLLIRTNSGCPVSMQLFGSESFADFTNKETQEYVWEKCKKNYFDNGVSYFWLDVAEPEYTVPDFEIYQYHKGPALECANIYPLKYAEAYYEGMKKAGIENPMNLIRCVWAGSQRYGAIAWSGDVPSSFTYLQYQIKAGLNMGIAGIPWWTCDIGGFHGGNINDPKFKELLVRWFEYGTFCPVMRLHGDRSPHSKPLSTELGGGMCGSGASNEIWSYGEKIEIILTKYINLREKLFPYIKEAMTEAHKKGTPVIKPLFYDYYKDSNSWEIEDEYLFGHDILVAPIYEYEKREREVYLPVGVDWINIWSNEKFKGGQKVLIEAPIEEIPLFVKENSSVLKVINSNK